MIIAHIQPYTSNYQLCLTGWHTRRSTTPAGATPHARRGEMGERVRARNLLSSYYGVAEEPSVSAAAPEEDDMNTDSSAFAVDNYNLLGVCVADCRFSLDEEAGVPSPPVVYTPRGCIIHRACGGGRGPPHGCFARPRGLPGAVYDFGRQ